MDRPFCHLHLHSEGSTLDGATRIPSLVKHVKESGMTAVALTDHGGLHKLVEFLKETKAGGILGIAGMEAYVAPHARTDKRPGGVSGKENNFHLTLLAKTGEGVRNLYRLTTESYATGYYYKPRVDKELLERYSKGLICLSGCVSSEFSDLILAGKKLEAEKLASWYEKVFGPENFFIEIQNNGVQIQREHEAAAVDFAHYYGLPLVATSDAHYLHQDDAAAHEVMLCINTKTVLADPNRFKFDTNEFFVRTPEQQYAAMPGHEEALKRTMEIANTVEQNYPSLDFGKRQFPSFPLPPGTTADAELRRLCEQGLKDRYGDDPAPVYRDRLEFELGVVSRLGFSGYFLMVWDCVRFARESGIPTNARGSACGAIISYTLYISHVCPIEHKLFFERFLSPDRNEAPDIDLDICQERRQAMIEYIKSKYGNDHVAQIGTFGSLAARAAIKDVGRVLGLPPFETQKLANLIPQRPGVTIADALKEEPELVKQINNDATVKELVGYATKIEGLIRNVGTHAAGIVITPKPLIDTIPLQYLPAKKGEARVVSTQWEMGDIEKAGILKVDILGLRNLTALSKTLKLIKQRHGIDVDIYHLPEGDPKTYALLQSGNAQGVFQLEGAGIRDLLVRMKPDCFGDLVALLALYRPGPLSSGMVDTYIDCKHGRKEPIYDHPIIKEITEETYSVYVYQEQLMSLFNRLGDIPLSQSYALIKAISKKKADEIAKQKDKFIAGAIAHGMDQEVVTKLWSDLDGWASYGFNRGHSTAYAQVAYQTAYLKANYPTEFMTALLSSEMDGSDREKYLVSHVENCRSMGLTILPPDINKSSVDFSVVDDTTIRFGLRAIKEVGWNTCEAIEAARGKKPFSDLPEFFERVPHQNAGPGVAEKLVKAGAFDAYGLKRSQLTWLLKDSAKSGKKFQSDQASGQTSLFDFIAEDEDELPPVRVPDLPELTERERDIQEKESLGFYLTRHPLRHVRDQLAMVRQREVVDLADLPPKTETTLAVLVSKIETRTIESKRSEYTRMAKMLLEDLTGSITAIAWPDEYHRYQECLREDAIVVVTGWLDARREPNEFVIVEAKPLAKAVMESVKTLTIRLDNSVHTTVQLTALADLLKENGDGETSLMFEILGVPGFKRAVYEATQLKLRYTPTLSESIEKIVGSGCVRVTGVANFRKPAVRKWR